MSVLKLQEVIWEITPRCNKNCTFCGSEHIKKNQPLRKQQILSIAKQLADYEVTEVNLSGGEPGTLDVDLLNNVIDILSAKNVKVKFVSNGTIFNKDSLHWNKVDVVGVSINTEQDIKHSFESFEKFVDLSKHTMITNFGIHNIFNFDQLAEYAKKFSCWQIQLTTGKFQLEKDGIAFLKTKINGAHVGKTRIVEADNLQYNHTCTAGIRSCGILYNGGVVACLSERSYCDFINVYGNVLATPLSDIWETKFRDIRFGKSCRKTCRDCFKYPDPPAAPIIWTDGTDCWKMKPMPMNPPTSVLYAVQSPPGVSVYATYSPTPTDIQPQVMAYAVIQAMYGVTGGWTTTGSGNNITIIPGTGTTISGNSDNMSLVYGTFKASINDNDVTWTKKDDELLKHFKEFKETDKKPKKKKK